MLHVSPAVEVYHKRDGGDHHQHHGRYGIEQEADVDHEPVGECEPGDIEYLKLLAHTVDDKRRVAAEEISQRHDIAQGHHGAHAEDAEDAGKLARHLHTADSEDEEHQERNRQNQYRKCNVHVLESHLFHGGDIGIAHLPVDVDDNRDRDSRLGGGDGDGEQSENHALHRTREKISVEHHEIEVRGVEDKFQGYEHGDHIFTGDEPVDAGGKHYDARHKIPEYVQVHVKLSFAGNDNAADYTR